MRTWPTAPRTATASGSAVSGSAVLVLLSFVWLLTAAPGCDNSGGKKGGKDGSASSSSSSDSDGGGSGGGGGGVAVVDLDKVAKEMGWTEQIEKSLQAAGKSLNQQLADRAEQLREAINAKKTELAEDAGLSEEQATQLMEMQDLRQLEQLPLSGEQRKQLIDAINAANQDIQQAQALANQLMNNRRREVFSGYRDAMKPAARRVANARGVSAVLVGGPNENLLYYASEADITEAVVDELEKSGVEPEVDISEEPTLNLSAIGGKTGKAGKGTGKTTKGGAGKTGAGKTGAGKTGAGKTGTGKTGTGKTGTGTGKAGVGKAGAKTGGTGAAGKADTGEETEEETETEAEQDAATEESGEGGG